MRIRFVLSTCSAALLMFSGHAVAKDNWTGFYTGVYSDFSSVDTHLSPSNGYVFDVNGFSGGLMFGYDQQFDKFVVGIEGDAGYSGVNGGDTGGNGWVVKMSGIDLAARARIGMPISSALIYGTGGVALSPMDMTYNGGSDVLHQTQLGWQVGGGIEFALSDTLNLRGEYLYTDYGLSNGLIPAPSVKMQTHSNTFRIGLSYKF